jgi:hypothetical protein
MVVAKCKMQGAEPAKMNDEKLKFTPSWDEYRCGTR